MFLFHDTAKRFTFMILIRAAINFNAFHILLFKYVYQCIMYMDVL